LITILVRLERRLGGTMKRRLVILSVLIGLVVAPLVGQFRADIGLTVPWRLGFAGTSLEGEFESDSVNILESWFLVLPEVSISYAGKAGPFTVGAGFRGFTVIVQSFLYPHVFAEFELGPVVTGLSVGGGLFPFIGFVNTVQAAGLVIPDLKAHVKLGESFRLGGGTAALLGAGDGGGVPFLVYLSGVFVLDL
jgi:hypothetical protein